MLVRCSNVVLFALVAVGLSGCCCRPWGGCYPCGPNWCGSSCGDLYWNEWYSIPPRCCDPCDCCGDFVGPRLNDGLYSHGNDYHGWCEHRHAHFMSEPAAGPVTAAPTPAVEASPAPAEEPYSPSEPEPYTLPGPSDEMPSEIPYDSSTRVRRDYPGRQASYEESPRPKRRAAFQSGGPRSLRDMLQSKSVDSRGPSRTLAKPPRTRLFSP